MSSDDDFKIGESKTCQKLNPFKDHSYLPERVKRKIKSLKISKSV